MITTVLPELPFRMKVYTVPKCLRGIFLRERPLLGDLCRVAYDVTAEFLATHFPGVEGVPYFVCAVHTFGSDVSPHPHVHALCSEGIRDRQGTFHRTADDLDYSPLEELFRHAVLAMLLGNRRITEETARKLPSWTHSGFSVDCSVGAPEGDRETLHRLACYLLKPPVALGRMTYDAGAAKVVYHGKPGAAGRDLVVCDPKEFLLRVLLHIPTCVSYYTSSDTSAHWPGFRPDTSRLPLTRPPSGGSYRTSPRSLVRYPVSLPCPRHRCTVV